MSSHITVLPASTQAAKETIRFLLASQNKPHVRGIYRDLSKAPAEFVEHPRFQATKGDVGGGTDLDFNDSNAVFYVPPPTFDGTDNGEFAAQAARNVANALQKSPTVKRLLLHSCLGSQYDHGIGVLKLNHISDQILKEAAPEVIIVKPCYYFENWAHALKTMQADSPSFESPFSPADHQIPMVAVKDVGKYCAKTLLDVSSNRSPHPIDLFGPRLYSSLDVKDAIEKVTGKRGELVTIPREGLTEFWAKQLPAVYVQDFVDFVTCQLPGGIATADYGYDENTVKCETELVDGLRAMT